VPLPWWLRSKYLCDHLHPSLPCTLSMNEEGMLCNLVPVSSNITKYKVRPPPPHTHTPPHTPHTR
jgi:hypothetical protein